MILPSNMGFIAPAPSGGGDAQITTAFLARTSGLDATHTNAYKTLINGLVTDGICSDASWGGVKLLYLFGTADTTTALLNLPSATFNGTAVNAPTFNADQGYKFIGGIADSRIDTAFNPTTQSVNQNSQIFGGYILDDAYAQAGQAKYAWGCQNGASTICTSLAPWWPSANDLYNGNNGGEATVHGISGTSAGLYADIRTGASTHTIRKNQTLVATNGDTSTGVPDAEMFVGAVNIGGSGQGYSAYFIGAFFLTDGTINADTFCGRINAFATTLGWNTY